MSINVVDRRGIRIPLQLETISERLKQLANMHPRLSVSTDMIAVKTVSALIDGILTSEIDHISADICASMIIDDPDYDSLAARITISDLHKNTSDDLMTYASDLVSYTYRTQSIRILHPKVVAFIMRYTTQLSEVVDYAKDYDNNYFGAVTLIKSYLLAYKYDNDVKVVKERPQQMLLRVAIGIMMHLIEDDGQASKETIADVLSTYELLASRYYTHATPTLFNAGTVNHTLSSCYLLAIDDSLDNIYSRLTDISKISKFSGGVGVHVSQVRASGSVIASTIGRSEGLVPLMRVFNESTRYVSQGGGKRKGSTAVYLEPWHADIIAAIMSQKQQGAPERLCRDLFLALWVPDLFMVRLKECLKTNTTVMWSLMCPHECPGLTDAYGTEFEQLYEMYEKEGRYRKQISIKKLWDLIVTTQIETGKPYLMFKDHVNRKCNQNNLGVIKSSNLCVSGSTPILTFDGYIPIKQLDGLFATVWNGQMWSEALVRQTGQNQELYRVSMSDGSFLDCTAEHTFYIRDDDGQFVAREAISLSEGDVSEQVSHYPLMGTLGVCSAAAPSSVPFMQSSYQRFAWLSTRLDLEAIRCLQITSKDIGWLRDIKLMMHTLGTDPFITQSSKGFHLRFSNRDALFIAKEMTIPSSIGCLWKGTNVYKPLLTVVSVEKLEGTHDTFCFNEPKLHRGVFNGVYTGNCSEITIYSDAKSVGVCNLASMCLPRFVEQVGDEFHFNYQRLFQVVQRVVVNMNNVMDSNKYPLDQAKYSDDKNRPIGIGVQGLSEVFMMMQVPFDSSVAVQTNKMIFETMYYAALVASNNLAITHGPYKTFRTSPTASGVLQFDLWGVEPSSTWDWATLKANIIRHGLRNSLLIAIMPTAGTSIISGHTESVEVPQSNVFTRSTLSGRFQVVNKHLVRELKALGLWTKQIRNQIIENEGSVQNIKEIPERLREVFKTVYEYKLTTFIKMCAEREAFVCQSASNNRYLVEPDIGTLTMMHLFSWKQGLKTSSYYCRVKQRQTGTKLLDTLSPTTEAADLDEEECLSCTA
jgi:ribonucleotide reductase alpha subunit